MPEHDPRSNPERLENLDCEMDHFSVTACTGCPEEFASHLSELARATRLGTLVPEYRPGISETEREWIILPGIDVIAQDRRRVFWPQRDIAIPKGKSIELGDTFWAGLAEKKLGRFEDRGLNHLVPVAFEDMKDTPENSLASSEKCWPHILHTAQAFEGRKTLRR